jgi:hypothetical protein
MQAQETVKGGEPSQVPPEWNSVKDTINAEEKPEFKAAVGLSRQWDARKAGREVAIKTLEQLGGKKPNFFLLFATIHYEKYGGFQEFLNGVWEILPDGTPLVGGTIAGFINNYGCFTRGATALAVSYPNMDVVLGFGKNTKRNPKKAAKHCAGMIKKNLGSGKYEHKFLFELTSGGVISFPLIGTIRAVTSNLWGEIVINLLPLLTTLFQTGVGREEDIFECLTKKLEDFNILGGSSTDDSRMERNYQFFGKETMTNSIVALGMQSDISSTIEMENGLVPSGKKLHITKKSFRDCAISEVDNMPATQKFLGIIGWPAEFLDEFLYKRTFFYPLGFKKDGIISPEVIGSFLGKNIVCGYKIPTSELDILYGSGKSLLNAADSVLDKLKSPHKPCLGIGFSCAVRLGALGSGIFSTAEKLNQSFSDTPFIVIYTAGESVYVPKKMNLHCNETFCFASFATA